MKTTTTNQVASGARRGAVSIYVAWSRGREDMDGHTTSLVHLQRLTDGDDDRTLCGIRITAGWEMDVWDSSNLETWVGCMRCFQSYCGNYAEVINGYRRRVAQGGAL